MMVFCISSRVEISILKQYQNEESNHILVNTINILLIQLQSTKSSVITIAVKCALGTFNSINSCSHLQT